MTYTLPPFTVPSTDSLREATREAIAEFRLSDKYDSRNDSHMSAFVEAISALGLAFGDGRTGYEYTVKCSGSAQDTITLSISVARPKGVVAVDAQTEQDIQGAQALRDAAIVESDGVVPGDSPARARRVAPPVSPTTPARNPLTEPVLDSDTDA